MYPECKALVISRSDEMRENLASAADCFGSVSVSDGSGARETVINGNYDLIILNTPLAEEFGLELASFICGNTKSALIITASQKNCPEISAKLKGLKVCVLPRPLNKQLVVQTINFVMSSRSEIIKLEEEKQRLEKTIRDLRQIDRAKCTLIQYLRISEEDAHRMIQKRAMDERVTEVQIAADILKTYEM